MSSVPPVQPSLLRDLLERNRGALAASSLLLVLWSAGEALVPMVIGRAIDVGVAGGRIGPLLAWIGVLAVNFAVLSSGFRFGSRIADRVLNDETHRLRMAVVRRAIGPTGTDAGIAPGAVVSLSSTDTDVAASFVSSAARLLAAVCGVAACAIYLLVVDWLLGVLVLVTVPLSLVALRRISSRVTDASDEQTQAIAAASGHAADLMRGLRALKGFGGERQAAAAYAVDSARATEASVRISVQAAWIEALQTAISGILLALVAAVAGWRVVESELTVGEFVAVLGLVAFVADPLSDLARLVEALARSRASARRLEAFLGSGPAIASGSVTTLPERPAVTVVRPGLPGLAPLELRVDAGELVAIACAEPRLGRAIVRALAGHEGAESVSLGGVARSELDAEHAPELVTVSPATADVLSGTLRSTISPAGEIDPEALSTAALSELVDALPAGLEHRTDALGGNLSGGQRQRVALARALASEAPVLVLHDPTSAVDAVTEVEIAQALRRRHDRRRTDGRPQALVIVTTSAALLAVADRVVVVRPDAPAVRGLHHELLERDADYRSLTRR